jgi:hypothetical protein
MIDQQSTTTAAATLANRNLAANLQALRDRQPELADTVAARALDVEWLFARDGSLTARTANGAWCSGSSLPRRTAQAVLAKMELGAVVTCYLAPTHAGQLRVTLDRLTPDQALIAALPEIDDLRLMFGCESFAAEIAAGRLWFAWGNDWDRRLETLLAEHDGLPVPGQFVRTALIEEDQSRTMIAQAQAVLSREIGRRAALMQTLFNPHTDSDDVLAIAPARFRLWEGAGHVIAHLASAAGWRVLNPDDPCNASPLAFARAAAGCKAVVAANLGRADWSDTLPPTLRVVTWLTAPRIPRFDPRAPHDALILADERWRAPAIASGWPAARITVGAWPTPPFSRLVCEPRSQAHPTHNLGIIADTTPIARPDFELSSHNVLWDTIAQELSADPFVVGNDPHAYLSRWLRRANIADDTVDATLFINRLIIPAYQQALVRILHKSGIDVALFGRGWHTIEEFARQSRGEINTPDALAHAIHSCTALVHVWPNACTHPIDAAGRPVLRRTFRGTDAWLADAKRLAAGDSARHTPPTTPPITPQQVMDLIRKTPPAHIADAA